MESTSVVDQQSGVVESPEEAIARLRELELAITRCDEVVAAIAKDLKAAREDREEAVRALRAACREAKTLPLFEDGREAVGAAE